MGNKDDNLPKGLTLENIKAAATAMDEAHVPQEDRMLYCGYCDEVHTETDWPDDCMMLMLKLMNDLEFDGE